MSTATTEAPQIASRPTTDAIAPHDAPHATTPEHAGYPVLASALLQQKLNDRARTEIGSAVIHKSGTGDPPPPPEQQLEDSRKRKRDEEEYGGAHRKERGELQTLFGGHEKKHRQLVATGTGCLDGVLGGGIELGTVVILDGCEAESLALTTLANALLQDESARAALIDTSSSPLLLRRLRDATYEVVDKRLRNGAHFDRNEHESGEQEIKNRLTSAALDRVDVMRVFDIVGLADAIEEVKRGFDNNSPFTPSSSSAVAVDIEYGRQRTAIIVVSSLPAALPHVPPRSSAAHAQSLTSSTLRTLRETSALHSLISVIVVPSSTSSTTTAVTMGTEAHVMPRSAFAQNNHGAVLSSVAAPCVRPILHNIDVHVLLSRISPTNAKSTGVSGKGGSGSRSGGAATTSTRPTTGRMIHVQKMGSYGLAAENRDGAREEGTLICEVLSSRRHVPGTEGGAGCWAVITEEI